MYDKLVEAVWHWIETVSPARKVADVAVVFIMALLAGGLLLAYNAENEIRRLAIKALDKMPELDRDLAIKLSEPLLADVTKAGGVAVACFRVDLASNTTTLIFYRGPDQMKEKLPRLKSGFDKMPFIFGGMPQTQLELAASMLTGTWQVAYYEQADVTLVGIPVPDRSGAFLAGFVMAAIPNKHDGNSPAVINLRLILSDFSRTVL